MTRSTMMLLRSLLLLAFSLFYSVEGFTPRKNVVDVTASSTNVAPSLRQQQLTKRRAGIFATKAVSIAIPDPQPRLVYPDPPKKPFKLQPIRSIWRFLEVYVLGFVSFALLFIVNTSASLLFVFLKFWLRKVQLRRFAGFVAAWSLPPLVELQFDFGRMLSYVPFLTAATDNLFMFRKGMYTADELVGDNVIPSDEQFISQVILRTPMAFYTNNTDSTLITDMSYLEDFDNYPNTYYDITKIEIDKATSKITIYSKDGKAITKESAGDIETWNRVKVHALNCISFFIPGIGHSWVHFYLLDTAAATVYNDLNRKSVLYSLLEPHVRYTSRINWEALGVRGNLVWGESAIVRMAAEATTTAPRGIPASSLVKKFEPWTPFAMPASEFIRVNSKRTTEYYLRSDEFACPPKWLNGPNSDIPYIKSLKRFYPIVRKHVAKVLSYEDEATILNFVDTLDRASEVDGRSLNLTRFDPVDVVSSIIFDGVFIHSTDHYFTNEILSKARYGIGTLRQPLSRTWYPGERIPEDIIDDEDRIRWHGFANVFIQFNDSKLISNSMKYLKYKFRRHKNELKDAGKNFLNAIDAEHQKMKKEGLLFCPIESLSRSICW